MLSYNNVTTKLETDEAYRTVQKQANENNNKERPTRSTNILSRRLSSLPSNMSKHRVDLNLRGTSHYVDGKLVDATGFPLWENTLPSGLRLEKRAGRPAKRDRKFVRTPGFGVSVEWTSNRV